MVGEGGSAYRGERFPTRPLVILAAMVAFLVPFLIGRVTAPDGDAAPKQRPDSSSSPTRPTDEASAVDAATRFARVMTGPSGDASTYLDQMRSIASPDWRSRAEDLARNAIDFVDERYGEGGSVEFEPLRYRVGSHSRRQAVIDIWGVVLGSGPKFGGIEESWITGTVNLVWVGSGWKVAGQSSNGGPTPELLRTEEGSTADEILNEFKEYSGAPGS